MKKLLVSVGFTFLLAGSLPAATVENLPLPDLGGQSNALISPLEEQRIGQSFMRNIRNMVTVYSDPLVTDYIQSLGLRLGNFSDNRSFDFTFFVVDDSSINAFAGPGGYIGVHRGLIEAANSESELASVLAHEIAHVTQFHLHRSLENARKMGIPTAAAIITAILIGATNPSAAEALIAASVAGSAQSQLQFSRSHEQEADRVGISLMEQAGFDPRAMPAFFETLHKHTRISDTGIPEFLATHPVTENRIADSRNRAEQFPRKQHADSVEFNLLKVQLNLLSNTNPEKLHEQYQQALKNGQFRNPFAIRYGLAMANIALKKYDLARTQLRHLIKDDQERSPYLLALAEVEKKAGNQQQALAVLKNAFSLYPNNVNIGVNYAKALQAKGSTEEARLLLRELIRTKPEVPEPYQVLGSLEEQSGRTGSAYRYIAEFHFLEGRTQFAIEHLKQAIKQNDVDKYTRSQIETRLTEFKEEFVRLKKEAERN